MERERKRHETYHALGNVIKRTLIANNIHIFNTRKGSKDEKQVRARFSIVAPSNGPTTKTKCRQDIQQKPSQLYLICISRIY